MAKIGLKTAKIGIFSPFWGLFSDFEAILGDFSVILASKAEKIVQISRFSRISRFISLPEWRLRRNLAENLTGFGSAARLRPQVKRFCRLIVPHIPEG